MSECELTVESAEDTMEAERGEGVSPVPPPQIKFVEFSGYKMQYFMHFYCKKLLVSRSLDRGA